MVFIGRAEVVAMAVNVVVVEVIEVTCKNGWLNEEKNRNKSMQKKKYLWA